MDWEKYSRNLIIVLAVYAVFFLFVFLPFLPVAAELNLLGDSFVWLIIVLNALPLVLFALYFLGRIEGRPAKLALTASAFAAVFLSVFFILPLQL